MNESLYYVPIETARTASQNCINAIQKECHRLREAHIADYMRPRWWRMAKTLEQGESEAYLCEAQPWHCEWSEWWVGGYELQRARKMLQALRATNEPCALLCADDAALVAKYKDTP